MEDEKEGAANFPKADIITAAFYRQYRRIRKLQQSSMSTIRIV
jgi:hypothetical protein